MNIGAGRTATPEIARQMHAHPFQSPRDFGDAVAEEMRILYGGSVKPDIAALMDQVDIDGALGRSQPRARFVYQDSKL
jgi:triosephosphate isomerase